MKQSPNSASFYPSNNSIIPVLQLRKLKHIEVKSQLVGGRTRTGTQVSMCMGAKLLQSRPTLCDHMDCSPPGSSVHGILQARVLEWVAIPSSRGLTYRSNLRLLCLLLWQVGPLPTVPPGKPCRSGGNSKTKQLGILAENCLKSN